MARPQTDGALGLKGAAAGDAPGVVLDASATAGAPVIVPGGAFLLHADYVRQGPDLKLVGQDGTEVLVVGYFSVAPPPALQGDTGLRIGAEVAAKLAGPMAPGQYAQTAPGVPAEPVAQVQTVNGEAVAIRADGTRVLLAEGSPVFQGDVLQTGPGAALALVYIDGMTMQLDADTRMVIDQLFYNPTAKEGAALFSLVEGAFLSLSGEIAKLGPDVMKVQTPTGTIGVRGTNLAASHIGITQVVLLENPDGSLGAIIFFNDGGFVILDQLFANVRSLSADFAPSQSTQFGSREEALAQIGVSSKALEMYDQVIADSQNQEAELLNQILGPEAGPPSGDAGSAGDESSISGFGIFTTSATGVTLTPLPPGVIEIVQNIVGTILPLNDPVPDPGPPPAPLIAPVATDDAYEVGENDVLSVTAAAGVLFNDSDANNDVLTVSAFDALTVGGGAVDMDPDGGFTYAPAPNFSGADSFTYAIADGNGGFDTATVSITVNPNVPTLPLDVAGTARIENAGFGSGPEAGTQQLVVESAAAAAFTVDGRVLVSDLQTFLGVSLGLDAISGSAVKTEITVEVGDVLSFDYNFLTDEPEASTSNDFAFAVVDGQLISLADTNSALAASPTAYSLETGFDSFSSVPFASAGIVGIAFGVVNVEDDDDQSAVLIDEVRLNGVLVSGFEGNQSMTAGAGEDVVHGGAGNDTLVGSGGDDSIYGSIGRDVMAGGGGDDLFRLAPGDGGPSVVLADVITGFEDGDDLIELLDGLTFAELTIDQGVNVIAGAEKDTVISISATSQVLAILADIGPSTTIDDNDFI